MGILAIAHIRDEKAAGTVGGTNTSGAWQTRNLNTEVSDPDSIVSISSNQFTLGDGTYFLFGVVPAYRVNRHKTRLRNITDSTDALIGGSTYGNSTNGLSTSIIIGSITIASAKVFEIQSRVETTFASQGYGVESNFAVVEVYTEVWIMKMSVDQRISDLTATTTLTGTEEFVLNDGGVSKKITAQDLADALALL